MPIIKSAKKRVRVAEKAAIRNSKTKRSLKTALKAFRAKANADTHAEAQSMLDTAAKKGLMHKNKAARLKAQLARSLNDASKEAGVKPSAKKAATKPAAAKKAAPAKKTTATKKAATAKKAPAKATAKKSTTKK